MSNSEREPLLWPAQTGTADAGASRPSLGASPIVRILLALRSGHLPDNAQLYAMLHASAAFCETISRAVIPSSTKYDSTAENGVPQLSNETTITLAALLKECATLCRTAGSWLYGKDVGDQRQSASRDDGEEDDVLAKRKSGARGNEKEQWQRLLWHVGQSLSSSTDSPISFEVEGEVQGDARKAADAAREAAVQVSSDASKGFKAICKLVAMVLGSDELLRIPSDIIRALRLSVADMAADIGGRAGEVDQRLRLPIQSGESTHGDNKVEDFVYPKEAIQEAVDKAADAVDGAISQPSDKGKQRSFSEQRDVPETWEDEAAKRVARLLEELRSDETFCSAADTFMGLMRKYMDLAKEVRDDVEVSATKEMSKDALLDAAQKGTEKARESLSATMASTHLDAGVSAHLSHHATSALQAAKEVLEGLAGGTSMDVVIQRAETLRDHVQSDSELRKWFDDTIDFLSSTIKTARSDDTASIEEQLKDLYARLQMLLHTRPAVVKAWEDLQRSMAEFSDALASDVVLRQVRARIQHITAMAKTVFLQGARDAKEQASNALATLLHAILPSLGQILGSIPLPRVEFTSDKLDAVVDDIHISSLDLIPDTLRLTTTNDWFWHRDASSANEAHVDTDLRLFVGGLRLAVSDVSFYAEERFTAPAADSCGGCCSCGHSQSDWCCFRGPSAWLSYTESALLDVGFSQKGAGITIDLRDAGQDIRKQKRGWWPFGSAEPDKKETTLDDVIRQYQSEDEMQEVEEGSIRKSFFDINDCQVHVDDSFDFQLRNSRHWIVNAMLRFTVRPIVKVLLRRVISAQIRHAFQQADERAYDLHLRAKLVRHRKLCRAAKLVGRPLPMLDDVHASVPEYVAVLLNGDAGKSKNRLRAERDEQRELEEKKRKEEEEEEHEQEEASKQPKTQQPQASKSMEVKRTGLIYHDEDGEYSIAIGVKPSGLVLEPRQHGPLTQRMQIREAIAHPQRTARDAKLYGEHVHEAAKQALFSDDPDDGNDDNEEGRDLLDGPRAATQRAQKGFRAVQDTIDGLTEELSSSKHADDPDTGWKSAAFDL